MDSAKAKAQMSAPYLETQVPFVILKEKGRKQIKNCTNFYIKL